MAKNIEIQAQSLKIPKLILISAKFLEVISLKLVTRFAAKLFTMPIKHKIPKLEFNMNKESKQQSVFVDSTKKEIVVYHYGLSNRKVLLFHSWSGRGTQLVKIADELIKNDFSTVSFNVPAYGKSKGNSTIIIEFIACILELDLKFGPFEYAIGHSFGGIAI